MRGPFGPSVPFPARPICCSTFRRWSASLALPTTNLLCPLLTSAPRSGTLAVPSVLADTMQISRGKLDRLHRTPAESTALALMDTGLRRYGPARPTRDASYSVSVRQVAALLPRFFQTAPRGHRPCASLALRLHQTLGRGLSPPSCQTCSAHPAYGRTDRAHSRLEISRQNARFPQASTAHSSCCFPGQIKTGQTSVQIYAVSDDR